MNVDSFLNNTNHVLSEIKSLKEVSKSTPVNIESIKSRIMSELDACLDIIKQSYEKGNLNELKQLDGHINLFIEKCHEEEILKIFNSIFNPDQQEFIERKIDSIIGELSQDILSLEEKEARYLDRNCLLKSSEAVNEKIKPIYRQWFISQAILHEGAQSLDAPTQKQLHHMILQLYRKAAGFSEAEALNAQMTPLFIRQTGYYRHDEFEITQRCCDAYAKEMGITNYKLFLIDSPLLREIFNREMPPSDLDLDISNQAKFDQLMARLLKAAEGGQYPKHPLLLDVSTVATQGIKPGELESFIHALEQSFNQTIEKWALNNKNIKIEEVRTQLLSKLQLIAFTQYKGQHILLLFPFFKSTPALDEINETIGQTGFRPSPAETIKAWLKVEDIQTILNAENIPLAQLATKKDCGIPTVCKNCVNFIQQPIFAKLAELARNPRATPYQKVLSEATVNLLNGLAQCKIDEKYQAKKVQDLLQISYFRILEAMNEAILRKDDLVQFSSHIEFIHQEIQGILSLVEPYGDGDFSQAVIDNLTKGKQPIIPANLGKPTVNLHASAMHSMASVMASVEAQKGSNKINVAVLKDTYFESSGLLEKAKSYQVSFLDGDHFNEKGIDGAFDKAPAEPIDLFVCEFHHNISLTRQMYRTEDIIKQIKEMHKKGLLAKPCTAVIDTTINLEHSDEIQELLADPEIHKLIQDGNLNIVLLRSAQKFDMFGFDNYYGGITVAINSQTSFKAFNDRMNKPEDQLRGFNYQGLTHLQKYGHADIFREAVIKNTEKLYNNLLSRDVIYNPATAKDHPMQISKMQDKKKIYLDVKFPNAPRTGYRVRALLRQFARERKLPLTFRSSFTFVNTNVATINNDIFRFNPGLDDENTLEHYALFFDTIDKALMEALKEARQTNKNLTMEEFDQFMLSKIAQIKIPQPFEGSTSIE